MHMSGEADNTISWFRLTAFYSSGQDDDTEQRIVAAQ